MDYLIALELHDVHHATIALRNLARLWQASSKALSDGDISLPGMVAAVLKIQPQEAEALLRKALQS